MRALVLTSVILGGVILLGASPSGSNGIAAAPARVIVLDAKGLAFSGSNPTLEMRAGERVRLVIRNTDPGVTHSFAVPGLGHEKRNLGFGEELVVDLTADQVGEFEYTCPRHMPSMKGKIVVRR